MGETASGSRAGSRVGRYLLKRLLGRGTTGEVYEAVDTHKDRAAAVKLLAPALGGNPAFREWLQREALVVGRVQEPHVVPVRDYGELDGQVFIDMPLVAGADLAALLKRNGVLPPSRAVNIVWQAASALDAAHGAGVIHRGVKPRNILVTSDDFVYLVDFGLAGAPGADAADAQNAGARWKYAAPELFSGSDFGPAVDIYALTCVLYQCLTGSPPYRADSLKMLANAHQNKPIPRPSLAGATIPAALDEVVAKGMAKDPQERYASAAELATAAYQALSAPDQHRTLQIYEASQQSTPPLIEQPQPGSPPVEPTEVPAAEPPVPPAATAEVPPDPVHEVPTVPEAQPTQSVPPPAEPTPIPEAVTAARPTGHPGLPRVSTATDDWFSSSRRPRLSHDPAKRKLLLRIGAALIVVVGLIAWMTSRSGSDELGAGGDTSRSAAGASQPTTTMSPAEAQARLLKLLPSGYPQDTCTSTPPSAGAIAEVTCGRNVDLDGPPAATYSLFPDAGALRQSFDSTVQATTVVTCPGRIQSPGPWHRTATPDKTAGTLLCGVRQGSPVLVWTNDANLTIGSLRTERAAPTLEQFYTWWSSHS
ncbi:serine/threonine protein kinase [Mycolicibacter heraklionensis]|uniref:non-specific serine/threonine protein kinase n=1 Tax=Mycolicibacter heraklionensis TaxID=512402 RepID=A0A9X7ZI66_9MYCO|nr:serine/threonine-protein kinase [Mycolicibacter heraklionensis]QZA09337.1 serine/threonine protein kinase [Mycolicibacter heraklionensis]